MSETIEDVVKRLRDRAEARRRSGKLLQIDDRMFDLIADEIEAAVKNQFRGTTETMPHLREVTKMEEVAVAKMETTTPTSKDSLQVGDAAKMREVLDEIRVAAMSDYEPDADYLIEKCNAALSSPPRNCDVFEVHKIDDEFEKAMGFPPSKTADERDELMRDNWFLFKAWLYAEAKGEQK
jgi:hypothetical protein